MFDTRARLSAVTVVIALLAAAGCRGPVAVEKTQTHADRFPLGTTLVVYDSTHDRTYFATEDYAQEQRTGARFALKDISPDALSISGVRDVIGGNAFVLDATTLRLARRLDTPCAWWEGSRLAYLRLDDRGRGRGIVASGRVSKASTGESEILLGDLKGRFFLGAILVRPAAVPSGPTYRLQFWERTKAGGLKLVRNLATTYGYEPGHMGAPSHFEALGEGLAVFDFPGGLVDWGFVGVLQGQRVTAPLEDQKGRPLVLEQPPIIAGVAIVGLAEATTVPGLDPIGDRYFYQVTETSISLKPIASNVVFVTYDPGQRAVGFGVADKDGVSVKWGSPPGPSGSQTEGEERGRVHGGPEPRPAPTGRAPLDAESPYRIRSRTVPAEFARAYEFLEFIKYPHEPTDAGEARDAPRWNTSKFLSYLSSKGVIFTDVNDDSEVHRSLKRIRGELTRRAGVAFGSFAHLSHIYSIPYTQYSELTFTKMRGRFTVHVADWYDLAFVQIKGKLYLSRCDYLMEEGD
jgi:hypothetical protein